MRSTAIRGLRRRIAFVIVALITMQVASAVAPVQVDTPPLSALRFIGPGGADAAGPGAADVRGFVRVVDGDTLDVHIRGHRVAVGLLGIRAPMENTACGRQATAALNALVRGGVHLEDDPTITFDSRLRRMYRAVTLDGREIADDLARAGVAVGDGRGGRGSDVLSAELEARAADRGCAWRGLAAPQRQPNGRLSRAVGEVETFLRGVAAAASALGTTSLLGPSAAAAATAPEEPAGPSPVYPAGFTQDVIVGGLVQPTAVAWLPDGRILISTKQGVVRIVKNGSLLPTPFINISDHVNSYFDHGLLGIAVDPNFTTNGYVYLLYTYEDNALAVTAPKAGRLGRVVASGDTASPATEVAILGTVVGGSCQDHPVGADCIPNDQLSHTNGNIKFAADGSLFLTLGDGASFTTVDPLALRSQNLDSLAGKLIHILPSGLGAPENPFYNGDPTANRSKVWAYGFRNAYRFNLRPSNGRPYVGDVGWNDIEEISVVPPGSNLGWPCYEGPLVQVGYQSYPACQALYAAETARAPLISYSHSNGSTSVTGGAFYTGTAYPAQYQGAYFYADYGNSFIRTLRVDANDSLVSGPTDFATAADGPVALEIGPDQNVYYLSINAGELRRIRYAANAPPNAVASVSPTNGLAPLTVNFSSEGSNDPENETLSYSWNFGDGTPSSTAANPSHTYTANGTYTATLTVTDPNGFGTATARVVVGNLAPTATITAPASTLNYRVGDVMTFSGSGSDPESGAIPPANLAWQVLVHHCPLGICHSHFLMSAVGSSGQLTVPDHGDDSYLEIELTATDSVGLTGSESISLSPQMAQVTLTSSPTGMQVVYDGTTGTAPFVRTSVVGSSHSIDTPSPQSNNTFTSWSDGGAQHHNIVVGAGGTAVTATFTVATATSLALNGTNAWASAPHNPELNITGSWTAEGWFKDESAGGYNHDRTFITIKGNTDADGEAPFMIGVAWNTLFAGARTGWSDQLLSTSLQGVSANAWHHVAAVLVASTRQLTIYLDGAQVMQGTIPAISPTGSSTGLYIGRNGSGSGLWRGKLDDVRVWNVARTATEIANSYRAELSTSPAGLVGNWTFNEAGGTVAGDTTTPAENATLSAGASWSPDIGNAPPAPDTTPPTISGVAATAVTAATASIGWITNEPADTQVEYGTTTAYGTLTSLSGALVTTHSQALSSLSPNTLYHYRIRSRDGATNLTTSGDFTFTTAAPDSTPPVITSIAATGVTNLGATIGWTTNEIADTQIEYGTTTSYGTLTPLNAALVTAHTQTLSGLVPNTLYHYRVRSRDGSSNLAISGDQTFTTTNTPPLNSLLLGGTNAFAEAALAAELNTTGDWTLESWFKDESPGGYNHDFAYIVMKGNTDIDGESPYVMGIQWNNLFAGQRTGWVTNMVSTPLGAVSANAWHHAAATFFSATRQMTLYLDGAQVAQVTLAARTTTGNGRPVQFGRNGNSSGMFRGKIDDVRLWNVTRTAAEISASYRSELASAPASLVGNWKFNEGTGTVAVDSSAAPQNAILGGAAGWSTDIGNSPPTPDTTPPVISAVSASVITSATASISWTTNEAADTQVEYGPTIAYGTLTTLNAALITAHSQQLTGLSPNTLYHYRVRSRDGSTNLATSADATFATAAPDSTPPAITAVAATAVTNASATIGWTTDEVADTQVEYGTTTAYGATTALDPALSTSHSQTLSGLAPNTLYHYRVRSRDGATNLATSTDFTFTTTNAPSANSLQTGPGYAEAPAAAELNITGDWTLEGWFKDENLFTGYNHDFTYIAMKGNTDANSEAPFMLGVGWNSLFAGSRTAWTNYTVTAPLTGVAPATWHHAAAVFVASTRQLTLYLDGTQVAQAILGARTTTGNGLPVAIGRNGNGSGVFRGKIDDVRIWAVARSAADINANYRGELSSAPASLVGSWRFNEGFGTIAADGTATPQNAALVGGAAWSADVGNIPPPPDTTPPTITGVSATAVTATTATIGWTTNEPADTQVEYGTTTAYGTSTTLNVAPTTGHSQVLTGLAPNTLYHYRVRSRDGSTNLATSSDFTFTTAAPDATPPTITAVAATGISNSGATISWTTNEPADAQVEYGTTASYGAMTTLDAAVVTAHSQTLSGLAPNTLYHYRVRSRDGSANLATSTDFTFTTTNAAPANSLSLGGGAAAAQAPHAAELNITSDWTLETWFRDETPGGYNHDFAYILLKGNTDAVAESPFLFGVGWNGLFAGERTGWTNHTLTASLAATNQNTWHHAAAVFVAATRQMTLYIDGTQVAQGTLGARTTTGNASPVEIGRNGNLQMAWRGKLDDIRIWNVARTAAEISANYASELASPSANLVANWRFNEGAGTSATDSTATPQNAALLGGATFSPDIHP